MSERHSVWDLPPGRGIPGLTLAYGAIAVGVIGHSFAAGVAALVAMWLMTWVTCMHVDHQWRRAGEHPMFTTQAADGGRDESEERDA